MLLSDPIPLSVEAGKGNCRSSIIHLFLQKPTNTGTFPNCLHDLPLYTTVFLEQTDNNLEILTCSVKTFTWLLLDKAACNFVCGENPLHLFNKEGDISLCHRIVHVVVLQEISAREFRFKFRFKIYILLLLFSLLNCDQYHLHSFKNNKGMFSCVHNPPSTTSFRFMYSFMFGFGFGF